jgi:hypothetical protein
MTTRSSTLLTSHPVSEIHCRTSSAHSGPRLVVVARPSCSSRGQRRVDRLSSEDEGSDWREFREDQCVEDRHVPGRLFDGARVRAPHQVGACPGVRTPSPHTPGGGSGWCIPVGRVRQAPGVFLHTPALGFAACAWHGSPARSGELSCVPWGPLDDSARARAELQVCVRGWGACRLVRAAVQQGRCRDASLCGDGAPAPDDTKGSSSR